MPVESSPKLSQSELDVDLGWFHENGNLVVVLVLCKADRAIPVVMQRGKVCAEYNIATHALLSGVRAQDLSIRNAAESTKREEAPRKAEAWAQGLRRRSRTKVE